MKYRKKRIRLKYKKERVILSDVLPYVMIPFLVKGYEQYVFMHQISMPPSCRIILLSQHFTVADRLHKRFVLYHLGDKINTNILIVSFRVLFSPHY